MKSASDKQRLSELERQMRLVLDALDDDQNRRMLMKAINRSREADAKKARKRKAVS